MFYLSHNVPKFIYITWTRGYLLDGVVTSPSLGTCTLSPSKFQYMLKVRCSEFGTVPATNLISSPGDPSSCQLRDFLVNFLGN